MRVRAVLFCLAAMLAVAVPAKAQQWALYGQATGATLRVPNTGHLYGGSYGFYHEKQSGLVSYAADFRGVMMFRDNVAGDYTDERIDMGLGGLRVGFRPHKLPIVPYVEGLAGLGYWRGGIAITRQDKTGFTLQGLGGMDMHVYRGFDWRIIEFSYGRLTGQNNTINPISASTGIVLRLP